MAVQMGTATCCSSNGMVGSALGHEPTAPPHSPGLGMQPDVTYSAPPFLSPGRMGHYLWSIYRFQESG